MVFDAIIFAWWAWAVAALVLVMLEIVFPAFVLLGLAIGAGVMSLLLLIGGPFLVGGSVPPAMLIFAVASLAAWLALRQFFKLPTGQVKTFDHDIND
ncbi:MAG: hypothetical protein ACPGRD_07360 [Planktomarina sp.]